jgi:hypothetical protein
VRIVGSFMSRRYNAFGAYMKNRFGSPVYKVIIDAGFTCPNRDGTIGSSGCIYCNNESFMPNSCNPALTVGEQIKRGVGFIRRRYKSDKFLAYFQPYTNTYAPLDELERLYKEALANPHVIGLAIGTRPDMVDDQKIGLIQSLAEKYFVLVEYGMQSIYDKTLQFINRGHDYGAFLSALEMTKNRDILIGVHIILGFPTETREEMLAMAEELSNLPVNFLKIHHLQIIKDTPLAVLYREYPFSMFSYDEYIDFVTEFLERLSPRIVLQRLFAASPGNVLIAPQWEKSGQEAIRDIERRLASKDTWQGKQQKIHSAQ